MGKGEVPHKTTPVSEEKMVHSYCEWRGMQGLTGERDGGRGLTYPGWQLNRAHQNQSGRKNQLLAEKDSWTWDE